MSYSVSGKGSKSIVKFTCPTCAAPLESPLEEACKRFPCPNCGKAFVTPGAQELKKLRTEQADAAARAAAAREAAEASAGPVYPAEVVTAAPVEYQSAPPVDDGLAALAAATRSPAETQIVQVPEYMRIVTGAFVLRLLSYCAYAIAAIIAALLIYHLVSLATAPATRPPPAGPFGPMGPSIPTHRWMWRPKWSSSVHSSPASRSTR
jgi:predicted RNA-binding Zn-ribbon protein involved in translation (DUF1610 family)